MKVYPSYKDSGALWIGDIPTHWTARKIKTLFRIKKEIARKEGYNVLSITQQGIKIKDVESNKGQIAQSYTNYQLLNVGEFAMNHMDLLTGWVDISPFNGVTSPDYRVFIRSEENASSKYLLYTLQTCYSRKLFYGLAQGVSSIGRCRLQATKFKNFVFPLPPTLEEQNAIVAYLDKKCAEIEELISRRQSIIERLRELKQSIIAEAVTKGLNPDVPMKESGIDWMREVPVHWTISKIKNKAKVSPRVDISHINFGDLITFTPMEYVKQGYFIPNNMPYEAKYNSYTPYAEGDIVIAKVTPCFENGNICIMNNLSSHVGFGSSELIVIRSNDILPAFLMYALRNPHFIAEGKKTMYGTGGLKRISPRFIPNCNIAVPPEKEQQFIVAYLDKKCAEIDELIARQEQIIEKLKELKTSTIAHVVTGKVDVRDAI